jgi:hypothetical protein
MTAALLIVDKFDYSQLDPDIADELREAAARIRERGREQSTAIIDIGNTLLRVKDKLQHGEWGYWLDAEFSMSTSTAGRYMRVAKWAADKSVTVTNLQPSTLYLFSAKSTPPSMAQEVLDCLSNDSISEKELKSRLSSMKNTKRAAAASSGATEGTTRPTDLQVSAPPAHEQARKFQRLGSEQEAAKAAVLMLRECLGDQFAKFVTLWGRAGNAFSSALCGSAGAAAGGVAHTNAAEPERAPPPQSPQIDEMEQQPTAPEESAAQPNQSAQRDFTTSEPIEKADQQPASVAPSAPEPHQPDDCETTATAMINEPEQLRAFTPELAEKRDGGHPQAMANLLAPHNGAPFTPSPGVVCYHKQGSCGYTGCRAVGRCLVTRSSEAAA